MQVNSSQSVSATPMSATLLPELDLKVYARILWHWGWLLLLCTLLAGAAAYVASTLAVPIYQATATLLVDEARNPTASYQDLLTSERIARTYAELMQRETTLAKVAQQFGIELDVLQDALTSIDVTPVRDTQLIKVAVEGISPELVAAVADTLPQVFITEINNVQTQRFAESKRNLEEQLTTLRNQIELKQIEVDEIGQSRTAEEEVRLGQLRNELTQAENSYANIVRSYEELRLTEVQSVDSVVIVENAKIPTAPIRPRPLVNTLLAAIVGAMLALGVIFLIEYLDDRIKTPQDLQSVFDTPILGAIAHLPEEKRKRKQRNEKTRQEDLITASQPRHPITEAYRSLRTNLQFSSVDRSLSSLLVTSAIPGEGKTTTAANLAVVLAQSGHTVILVDADIRKPQQHKVFDLPKSPGLTDAMVATSTPLAFFLRETGVANLRVMTSGKEAPNPSELLGSQRMHQVITALHQEAEILIFDAPPLLAVTDAQVLAPQVQGVVLVINLAKTPRTVVARAAEALQHTNGHLFGAVLNRLVRSPRNYYYYYDSYSYYYNEEETHSEESAGRNKPTQRAPSLPIPAPPMATKAFAPQAQILPTPNGHYQLQSEQKKP